jgi:hypothetical protein
MGILQEYIMFDEQKDVDKFFDIAKSKDLNFANNIHNYMFMYRSKNELYFKNINTRKTISFSY